MSTIEDAAKTGEALKLTAADEEDQRYLILEEHDMELKDLLAQYDESKEEEMQKNILPKRKS
jgi:hypothetical protein